jgi:hypothetical protein
VLLTLEAIQKEFNTMKTGFVLACLGGLLWLVSAMSATAAETLPANVTACVSEVDAIQRLACFDREIARYYKPNPAPVATEPASNVRASAATLTPSPAPTRHLFAHIVSIQKHSDGVVLNLDNGQSWRTSEATPISIDLRVGDVVTIDKSLGSFWLTGRVGETLQVREEKQAASAP